MHAYLLSGFEMTIKNPNMLIFEQDFVSLRDLHHVLCRDEGDHGTQS
jgi:hypothetical protein